MNLTRRCPGNDTCLRAGSRHHRHTTPGSSNSFLPHNQLLLLRRQCRHTQEATRGPSCGGANRDHLCIRRESTVYSRRGPHKRIAADSEERETYNGAPQKKPRGADFCQDWSHENNRTVWVCEVACVPKAFQRSLPCWLFRFGLVWNARFRCNLIELSMTLFSVLQ